MVSTGLLPLRIGKFVLFCGCGCKGRCVQTAVRRMQPFWESGCTHAYGRGRVQRQGSPTGFIEAERLPMGVEYGLGSEVDHVHRPLVAPVAPVVSAASAASVA